MRLNKLHIKSFKSIDVLENLHINDTKITSIIGKNGSGKSNILHAINVLKNTNQLTDSNRYEKIVKDQEIVIRANFMLDETDTDLFEDIPIDPKDIDGFIATVTKKMGEDILTRVTPINFDRKVSSEIVKKIKPIVKQIIRSTDLGDDQKEQVNNSFDTIQEKIDEKQSIDPIPEIATSIDTIKKIVQPIDEDGELSKMLEHTKRMADFDIISFLEDLVWPKLDINLISLDDYPIKTGVPLVDIANGKHLFIQDLLDLIQMKVEDFQVTGEDLNNNKNDASEIFNQQLKEVWEEQDLKFVIDVQGESLMVFFITPQKRRRKLEDLSDGQKWFLGFYTKLAVARRRKKQVLWLFDEPGRHLHASAQHDLQKYFEDVSIDSQIFYTSHQPLMIPWHRLERILVTENSVESGTILSEKIWKDSKAVSPLREALGLFVGESLLTGREHVIVEGPSDYIYLTAWLIYFQKTLGKTTKFWTENFSSNNRTIVPAGGEGNIPLYLLFLASEVKNRVSTVAIPDTKDLSKKIKRYVKNKGLNPLTQMVFSFEEIVGEIERPIKDVEDLFEPTKWLTFVKTFYQSNFKQIQIPENFENPTKTQLEDGIISYVKKALDINDIDKTGIAFEIYRKLVNTKVNIFSKEARLRFRNTFKKIDSKFKLLNKMTSSPDSTFGQHPGFPFHPS